MIRDAAGEAVCLAVAILIGCWLWLALDVALYLIR